MKVFLPPRKSRLFGFALAVIVLTSAFACSSRVYASDDPAPKGKVYLVGMGPGDRELVTLKAARILEEADYVFCFGYLKHEVARFVPKKKNTVVSSFLLAKFHCKCSTDISPEEQRKRAKKCAEETAEFLTKVRKLVAEGKTVAFAAAGDPTMYCPWSWIVEDLADLDPIVVPGLSSFNAANAALKQSMTKDGGSILISSGTHLGTPDENGRLKMMLVFFTQSKHFDDLLPLLQARYPADTPIALVGQASYEEQLTVYATLGTISQKLKNDQIPKLYLIYVGDGLTLPTDVPCTP